MPKVKGNKRTAMNRSRCKGKFVNDISIVESSSLIQNSSNLVEEYPFNDANNEELEPTLIDEANDDEEDDDGDSYYDLDVLDEDLNLDLDLDDLVDGDSDVLNKEVESIEIRWRQTGNNTGIRNFGSSRACYYNKQSKKAKLAISASGSKDIRLSMIPINEVVEETDYDVINMINPCIITSKSKAKDKYTINEAINVHCTYSFDDLKNNIPIVVETKIPIAFIRRAERHCFRFMSGYRNGLDGALMDYCMKVYSSHRRIPAGVIDEVTKSFEESNNKKRK